MAAVDLILAKDNALKKIKPEVFGSLRSVLSTLPHEATQSLAQDENMWQKVAQVRGKIEANIIAQKENHKMAKRVSKAIETKLAHFQDMLQFMQQARAQELLLAEPEGVWDDLEAYQPTESIAVAVDNNNGPVSATATTLKRPFNQAAMGWQGAQANQGEGEQ